MKACTRCGEEKPLDEFTKDKRSRDGRQARCKLCNNADARARYAKYTEDPEFVEYTRARSAAWREANPEKARLVWQAWRERNLEACRDRCREYMRTRAENNPEWWREYYADNVERERERGRLSMRQSRLNNPEAERDRRQRYRARHPDRVRARERENTHRRRAMLGAHDPELAELMALLLTMPCVYCGATEQITIDHVVPLSRGGKHEAENLAPACLPCNCSKNNKLLSEWNGRAI